jgi:hypothetical protein
VDRRAALIAWLCLQGGLGILWWILVLSWPGFRAHFLAPGAPSFTLHAYALPDAAIIIGGSFAAALGLRRGRPWARAALWFTAGGVAYATLYCLLTAILSGGAWAAPALMAPALALTLHFAMRLP